MADWSRKKVNSSTINEGQEYTKDKNVSVDELNSIVNSGLYSQDFAERLVTNIDTSEVGNVGTPSVSLVAGDGATAEKPYKKFKFSNLKGDTGATGATGAKGDKGEKGDQGIQGEKGDQGVQGVQGEKGEKGDKGDTGVTPNITATATTLPAGSSATVTKSGTAENPAFAFGIPKGDKGEKGEKGDKGESGLIYQTTGQNTDGAMSQKTTTDALNGKVPTTRKVNNKALSSDITLSASDVGAITKTNLLDFVYPVGSIYMSMNNTSPQTFLGGTWERIQDKFLLSAGSTYGAGTTGGESTHTLTIGEMPSHTHTQNSHNHTEQGHNHTLLGGKSDTNAWSANVLSLRNSNNKSACVGAVEGTEDIKAGNYYQTLNRNGYSYVHESYAIINTTTATNNNTGGGSPHNNMPPYLAVYMWKRTA